MEVYRKQISRGQSRYLVLTSDDKTTRAARAVVVDTQAQTVQRVQSVSTLLQANVWQPLTQSDPTLDELVRRVPALRPFRGIEICLPSGETAWIRWRLWSSEEAAVQELLTETTRPISVPAYEPDGDHFLATQATAVLGGEVLDKPRAAAGPIDSAY